MAQGIDEIPDEKTTVWTQQDIDETLAIFEKVNKELQGIPEEKTTVYTAEVDDVGIEIVKGIFQKELPDESIVLVQAKTDESSINTAKAEIDKIPKQKELEIILKGEIDKDIALIKANADVLQTAFEWEAKVDIAEVEAAAEIITAFSGDIATMFESSGDVISDLAKSLGDLTGFDKILIEDILKQEAAQQAELLAIEKALAQTQIDYITAKTNALKQGKGLVTITADNLEPELQLVLHKIIQLTQIQANEEGLEFLIGV